MTAPLTDRERHMIRHALGLTASKVGYRNRYTAGGADITAWRNFAARGLAHEWSGAEDGFAQFCVRRDGVLAVLQDGERLDREEADFLTRLEAHLREPQAIEVAA